MVHEPAWLESRVSCYSIYTWISIWFQFFYINFLLEYLKVWKDRISFSWFSYSCIFYILVQRRLYKGYRVSAIPKLIFFLYAWYIKFIIYEPLLEESLTYVSIVYQHITAHSTQNVKHTKTRTCCIILAYCMLMLNIRGGKNEKKKKHVLFTRNISHRFFFERMWLIKNESGGWPELVGYVLDRIFHLIMNMQNCSDKFSAGLARDRSHVSRFQKLYF